jgi:methyltransferase (TIGR00027 family)
MDTHSPASRTALGAARHRAVHQLIEHGAILADPLAVPVLGEPEAELLGRESDRRMRWFICTRQRYAEDVLADAVHRGVDQLVVLGAGLDTFGYRSPHAGLRVVEMDHPATQAWKQERLAAAGIAVPPSVRFAPVDFERDDLGTVLSEHLEPDRPALFWWLGVTPYLSEEAVTATLTVLGSLAHSGVVLDHGAPTPDDASAEVRRGRHERRARVAALGEPFLTEFEPAQLAALLHTCGFADVHLEDEAALARRLLGLPAAAPRRVTHLALATRGWPATSSR